MATPDEEPRPHPVNVRADPATTDRNRLTTALRLILALPHLVLVGGPMAVGLTGGAGADDDPTGTSSGFGAGLFGIAVFLVSIAAWIMLVITARHPDPLWRFSAFYLAGGCAPTPTSCSCGTSTLPSGTGRT